MTTLDLTWFDVFLIVGAVQGFILAMLLRSIKHRNAKANVYLELLILVNALFVFGRALWAKPIVGQFPVLILSLDVALFFFGPLLFCYIKGLYGNQSKGANWIHFIPGFLFIMAINPFMEYNFYGLRTDLELKDLHVVWTTLEGSAWLYTSIYVWCSMSLLEKSHPPNDRVIIRYSKMFLWLVGFGMVFWGANFILRFTPWQFIGGIQGYSFTWLYLVSISYLFAYFAINHGEVFRRQPLEGKYSGINISTIQQSAVLESLESLMISQKPFLNPTLSLGELSKMVGTRSNILSMLINLRFKKNFHDYINAYRIEEFKERASMMEYRNFTLEAIAKESGFNSKTAFHRSFRKVHRNTTPAKYLQTVHQTHGEA